MLALGCAPEAPPPELADIADVVGVANWDDDDGDGAVDASDGFVDASADDERVSVALDKERHLELRGDGVRVRDHDTVLLQADGDTADLDIVKPEVQVEFLEPDVRATLVADGREITLASAPLVLSHPLQAVDWAGVMEQRGAGGNETFVDGVAAALDVETFPLVDYGYDVWLADEIELATMTLPDHRVDVALDSVRGAAGDGLGFFAEEQLLGPDMGVYGWSEGPATEQDDFGNVEVTPPFDSYPLGRVYWGEADGVGPAEDVQALIEDQGIQAPFAVEVGWLCSGHVDVFLSFVPDDEAPKGFRLVVSDPTLGLAFLDAADPSLALPRYDTTVAALQADEALRAFNVAVQANIDDAVAAFGFDEADLLRVPALFAASPACDGKAVPLVPATADLVVAGTDVLVPDPFFRADADDADPFEAAVAPLFPSGLTLHWVDDWDWYHLAWGEVHGGVLVRRAPDVDWWEVEIAP